MRYTRQQKAQTHAKLLKLASETLRKKGPDNLGVLELMRSAGLTHGGFYAHFKSRDAMLLEALKIVLRDARQKYQAVGAAMPPREALRHIIDDYVSPAHRDRPSFCPIVTLSSDVPRQPRKFRAAYRDGVQEIARILDQWIGAAGVTDRGASGAYFFAAMSGAIAMSRSVQDRRFSDELLAAMRAVLKGQLGLQPPVREPFRRAPVARPWLTTD